MDITPVSGYEASRYPSFREYFSARRAGRVAPALTLAAALALLASVLSGCGMNGSIA